MNGLKKGVVDENASLFSAQADGGATFAKTIP